MITKNNHIVSEFNSELKLKGFIAFQLRSELAIKYWTIVSFILFFNTVIVLS